MKIVRSDTIKENDLAPEYKMGYNNDETTVPEGFDQNGQMHVNFMYFCQELRTAFKTGNLDSVIFNGRGFNHVFRKPILRIAKMGTELIVKSKFYTLSFEGNKFRDCVVFYKGKSAFTGKDDYTMYASNQYHNQIVVVFSKG